MTEKEKYELEWYKAMLDEANKRLKSKKTKGALQLYCELPGGCEECIFNDICDNTWTIEDNFELELRAAKEVLEDKIKELKK